MIELKQVSKTFKQGDQTVHALKNIDLKIQKGQIFGVIGASGAGKSTLIRIVNLLESPTQGAVLVDGVNLVHLNRTQLTQERQKIGMIFQHFNLLSSRTVFENVALPLELSGAKKEEIQKKVTSLLELVGLKDKDQTYPNSLSGGQKQRVAIARALANAPKVLLCDEATSALDPATTRSILNLLQTINQKLNLTVLLITHEMDVVKRICHEVAIISAGELIEKGPVGEIFSHPKTDLARAFIRSTMDLCVPDDYAQKLQTQNTANLPPLVRLEFSGSTVDAPLITQAARKFNIDISILSSDMDYAGGVKFGLMLAEFFGDDSSVEAALSFLKEHNIQIQVLGYVA